MFLLILYISLTQFEILDFFNKSNYETQTTFGVMNNILFKKKVSFKNVLSAHFYNCVFEEYLSGFFYHKVLCAAEPVYRAILI